MTTENVNVIVKGVDAVKSAIAGVKTGSAAYKMAVSSALLSALSHHVIDCGNGEAAGGFELVTALINEVAETNPRDLKVIATFIRVMSPFELKKDGLKTVKKSKIEIPEISGRIYQNFTDGDKDAKDKAQRRDNQKKGALARFIAPIVDAKGNTLSRGAKVKSLKAGENDIIKDFECNVFDWFDYVEYAAKSETKATEKSADAVKVAYIDGKINALNDLRERDYLSDETKAAVSALMEMLFSEVKESRDNLAVQADAKNQRDQLQALENAGASADKARKWESLRANLVKAGKSLDDIKEQFSEFLKDTRKEIADAKAAEKAKAKK